MTVRITHVFAIPGSRSSGLHTGMIGLSRTSQAIDSSAKIISFSQLGKELGQSLAKDYHCETIVFDNMFKFFRAIAVEGRTASVLHFHGAWTYSSLAPAFLRRPNVLKVLTPHGTLARNALAISAWKKKIVWALLQRRAFNACDVIHATSEIEARDIGQFSLRPPIVEAFLPLAKAFSPAASAPNNYHGKTALFLGRLHPIKGVDLAIKAWAKAGGRTRGWRFLIVGPEGAKNYAEELKALVRSLELNNIEFLGEVQGERKNEVLSLASFAVLPSLTENFGYVMTEALSQKVPIITTDRTPWRHLDQEGCGWVVPADVNMIADAIVKAIAKGPDGLEQMGRKGAKYMTATIGDDALVRAYTSMYTAKSL